ncbi:hypothetical protein SAMN05216369_2657 [Marinobacter antarcticus]|uniref:Uncharacterized protein n=1 Tax=Marinobacter antarcticus TaxID=564117 RepID=A0A1M6U8F2_9GAMM|nr:hypothetical protein [Marinobacter antarcticus]SHK65348.1 hypothetical protein SAMN05216369_2657 [Marinobacter antarcticus]
MDIVFDMSTVTDIDEVPLYIEDLLSRPDSFGSHVILRKGHFQVVEASLQKEAIDHYQTIWELNSPITDFGTKFFLISLDLLMRGDALDKRYFYFDDGVFQEYTSVELLDITRSIGELKEGLKLKDLSSHTHDIFKRICCSDDLKKFGDIGRLLRNSLRPVFQEFDFIYFDVYGDPYQSYGKLRAYGVPESILVKWNSLFKNNKLIPAKGKEIFSCVDRIRTLCSRCRVRSGSTRPNYDSAYWPMLYASTAAWFMRESLTRRSDKNTSVSLLFMVRSFELMLQAQSLISGQGVLSPSDGNLYISNRKVEGCGKFIDEIFERRIDCRIRNVKLLSDWTIRARTILSARNHCQLAHGVLNIERSELDVIFNEIRNLIEEFSDEYLYIEYKQTFSDLSCPDFFDSFQASSSSISEDFLIFQS